MIPKHAQFRFYEELNDFLSSDKRKVDFSFSFTGAPAIKDTIEALGVPHCEIDLILVNGISVNFKYQLKSGDRVSVYPEFETFDISPLIRLRPEPLRLTRFIADIHLGNLARDLRLLGFDVVFDNKLKHSEMIELSKQEKRIILSRNLKLLKIKSVTRGYFLRSTNADVQTSEVLERFNLTSCLNPFSRCLTCNGLLKTIPKKEILSEIPPKTAKYYNDFYKCQSCKKVYWKGSHYHRMQEKIQLLTR